MTIRVEKPGILDVSFFFVVVVEEVRAGNLKVFPADKTDFRGRGNRPCVPSLIVCLIPKKI